MCFGLAINAIKAEIVIKIKNLMNKYFSVQNVYIVVVLIVHFVKIK